LTGAEVVAGLLAALERLRLAGEGIRMGRGSHPAAMLEIRAARGSNDRPGLAVTVTNPGPSYLYLRSVGVTLAGRRSYANEVGRTLAVGRAPHTEWLDLSALAVRTGLQDPVSPITHVFAEMSVGTARLKVDAQQLLAELQYLYRNP
jgi:hypothetical protein